MILMFIVGALTTYSVLSENVPVTEEQGAWDRFMMIASNYIWRGEDNGLGALHVAAFAWVANLAMHGGLSDMTLLRFARKSSYGYLSALGMFLGHYMAWICAGIMGAGAAFMLKASIVELDAGAVAFQALGATGIIVVIIAGWTTSNPTIYRAGLAFHSLHPRWNRTVVTAVTGIVTTIIACFPFVFTKLMAFVGLMGLILAPIGAVIVAEHWLFPRLNLTRYWNTYRGGYLNLPACLAWVLSLLAGYVLNRMGLHLFFLLIPVWIAATAFYIVFAALSGARKPYPEQAAQLEQAERERQEQERVYLETAGSQRANAQHVPVSKRYLSAGVVAVTSLLICLALGIEALRTNNIDVARDWLLVPTLLYMISATIWSLLKEKHLESAKEESAKQTPIAEKTPPELGARSS
jgi:cytosine permease